MLLLTVYKLIFLFYEKNKKIHKSHAKLILKMKYVRNIVVICFFTHLCYNLFIQRKAVMELSNSNIFNNRVIAVIFMQSKN